MGPELHAARRLDLVLYVPHGIVGLPDFLLHVKRLLAEIDSLGESALQLASEVRPDVVLLDIGMPGMLGYEVARRLRTLDGAAHAMLIAVTGYGQESDVNRARAAGFDHHLVKPVDFDKLRALLATRQASLQSG